MCALPWQKTKDGPSSGSGRIAEIIAAQANATQPFGWEAAAAELRKRIHEETLARELPEMLAETESDAAHVAYFALTGFLWGDSVEAAVCDVVRGILAQADARTSEVEAMEWRERQGALNSLWYRELIGPAVLGVRDPARLMQLGDEFRSTPGSLARCIVAAILGRAAELSYLGVAPESVPESLITTFASARMSQIALDARLDSGTFALNRDFYRSWFSRP